ncbi:hypothetical protein H5T51_05120 [Candidatus Bathyarchaeota archaeon]|nr:hypothetical protein [Candidatus Bathyarchaeota archaeon]
MIALPWKPKKPECNIVIKEVKFSVENSVKHIEIFVENKGNAECVMIDKVRIKPMAEQNWTEIHVDWDVKAIPSGGTAKTIFRYEWMSGEQYLIKALTNRGIESLVLEKAP